jgi:hypothetical protein
VVSFTPQALSPGPSVSLDASLSGMKEAQSIRAALSAISTVSTLSLLLISDAAKRIVTSAVWRASKFVISSSSIIIMIK